MHQLFADTASRHFVSNQGVLHNLNENHIQPISNRIAPHMVNLVNHLKSKINNQDEGGSAPSGGSLHTGGSLGGGFIASGGVLPFPNSQRAMYHYLLNLSPQQLEAYRETSAQMLGASPSAMWGKLTDNNEPLETDENEYENILRMPNTHAAARMLEADSSSPTGGGFYKALRHVGRKVTALYKVGRGALKFADRNKDLLLDLPGVRDYKEGISSFLETANAIDDAVNPMVDIAIDAARESATQEQRNKLKQAATQSIDKAIETHLPQAKKYVDAAKDLGNTVNEMQSRVRRPVANIDQT